MANKSSVLILCDDPEFAHTVVARWQTERQVPSFTLLGSDVWDGRWTGFQMAIVGALRPGALASVLGRLELCSAPALCISDDAVDLPSLRSAHPRIPVLRPHDGWVDTTVLMATEILRRSESVARASQAERTVALSQRYAALGRYMLEMRHNFNNAMTSVLGNAELLLLEPHSFSPQVREQIDTIHTMAMRMHEIMQRFNSLEAEMQFAERKARRETAAPALPV